MVRQDKIESLIWNAIDWLDLRESRKCSVGN